MLNPTNFNLDCDTNFNESTPGEKESHKSETIRLHVMHLILDISNQSK